LKQFRAEALVSPTIPRAGIAAAAIAYFAWGLFPLYWSLLVSVPTFQLLAHRVAWCAICVWIYLLLKGDGSWWRSLPARVVGMLVASSVLISINWGVFIAGVNAGHVVDTSLGYFITPLANVLFGVAVLRERLNALQWLAVVCAALGVAYLALSLGSLPWIAITLALSFAGYGLLRKMTPVDAVHGLAMESTIMLLPSLAYLAWCEGRGEGAFLHQPLQLDALLIAGGVVTAVPLALFAFAARRVPMTMLGFLQYLAPTVTLLLAIFVFHEPFGQVQLVAFGMIWLALALFSCDALRRYFRRVALLR
jgi:chloramphenicol-sensitive protein RarD